MFRLIKRLVNYIRFRKVARQIDKRQFRKMIETQKFLDSYNRNCYSYLEELSRALQE